MIEQAVAGKPEKYMYVFERKIYFIYKYLIKCLAKVRTMGVHQWK